MSTLKTIILSLLLVCVFLISPCCVHCDRRPDLNSKRRPFTSFCFVRFLKSFYFVPVCLSRGMEVAARYSRHSPLQVGVGVRQDRRECRDSAGRKSLKPAVVRGSFKPTVRRRSKPPSAAPSSHAAVRGSPVHTAWSAGGKPAWSAGGKPTGRRCLQPTRHGQECRVYVLLCPQEHFNIPCLVHGDSSGAGGSSSCGHGGQSQPPAPPVAEVEAVAEGPCEGPWLLVMPRGSRSFQASPGGLPVPVGCLVLCV